MGHLGLTEALVFVGVMVYMIASQVGRRPLILARLLRPLIITAVVALLGVRGVVFAGGNGELALAGVLAGAVFGTLASAFVQVERAGGRAVTVAGWPYALVWVVSMGGRIAFGLLATGGGRVQEAVVQFSMQHGVTDANAWRTAFILMTVSEILVRTLLVQLRARRPQRSAALA